MLVTALHTQFPTVRACTELPADLEQVLPTVQVTRFGGGTQDITMDWAIVDLDIWAATLEAADILGSQIRTWLELHLAGRTYVGPSGSGTFARVRTQSGFAQRPSGNPDVKRIGGVTEFWVHSF